LDFAGFRRATARTVAFWGAFFVLLEWLTRPVLRILWTCQYSGIRKPRQVRANKGAAFC
jgi:hypothetical protein